MNSKHLANAILVACVAAGAAWWWWPVTPVPKKTPVAHSAPPPAQEAEMPPATPPPEPAEPSPAPVVAAEAPPAPPPSGYDPQSELITAIPDFIRLVQAGDFVALLQTYMSPDTLAKIPEEQRAAVVQMMQTEMQGPQGQQQMQRLITDMQAAQNVAPTLDETGNRATYTLPAGSSAATVVFVKVNGRWYRE